MNAIKAFPECAYYHEDSECIVLEHFSYAGTVKRLIELYVCLSILLAITDLNE